MYELLTSTMHTICPAHPIYLIWSQIALGTEYELCYCISRLPYNQRVLKLRILETWFLNSFLRSCFLNWMSSNKTAWVGAGRGLPWEVFARPPHRIIHATTHQFGKLFLVDPYYLLLGNVIIFVLLQSSILRAILTQWWRALQQHSYLWCRPVPLHWTTALIQN